MKLNSKIYIAGHGGLIGSAIYRILKARGYRRLIIKTREELDLMDEKRTLQFFIKYRPEYVFMAAARVGSIAANLKYPANFISENLQIQLNVIKFAYLAGVKKMLFFGSNCMYPRLSKQPIKEQYLYSGSLEPTNQPYAVAKLAGLELCRSYNLQYGTNFLVAIPASTYGPCDHFDLERSHVVSSLIVRFHKAKINGDREIILWGDGFPRREFIYSDDVAQAGIFMMNNLNLSSEQSKSGNIYFNLGTNSDCTISQLADVIKEVVGYNGKIIWDVTKPNGMLRKLLDSRLIHSIGWEHKINLKEGLERTYKWYLKSLK